LLTAFLRHSRRATHPIWDVRLFFSNRTFTFSCGASLIMYSATYANVVLMSLYLQYLRELSAFQAGMLIMVQPISMAILSPLMGRWSDHIEPRRLASAGMAATAAGLVALAMLGPESGIATIVAALLLTGTGFSLFSSPNVNAIMGSVGHEHAGSASAAVATTRLLGQLNSMVLVALMLTLVMGATEVGPETLPFLDRAITWSFLLAAALCLPGIVLSLTRGNLHTAASGPQTPNTGENR
jgi:MFS family permease